MGQRGNGDCGGCLMLMKVARSESSLSRHQYTDALKDVDTLPTLQGLTDMAEAC